VADDLHRRGEPHIAHAYRASVGRGCTPRPEPGRAVASALLAVADITGSRGQHTMAEGNGLVQEG